MSEEVEVPLPQRRKVDTVDLLVEHAASFSCQNLPFAESCPFERREAFLEEWILWGIIDEWARLKGFANADTKTN